jgi:hypothetical protein
MGKSKWVCNHDEHINKTVDVVCEICGNYRPVISVFAYNLLDSYGDIEIEWSVDHCDSVYIKLGRKKYDVNGRKGLLKLIGLKHKTKIHLCASNQSTEISEEKSVLFELPVIQSFVTNNERPLENSIIELFWKTKYASKVKIEGIGDVPPNASRAISKPISSYKITAENAIGKVEQVIFLNVLLLPRFNNFKVLDSKIECGNETQLFWDVENVSKVELHWLGNMEVVNQKGEKKIPALEHTTFKIVVTALDGISKVEKEVTVYVFKRIEIKSFVSDLEFALESLPIKLKWEIVNATNITLCSNTESDLDVSGTNEVEIYLKKTSTLFLKANNDLFSSESDSLKIEIQYIPTFSPSIIPRLPAGNELIPTFNLDFKEISDNVLSDSQLRFQKVMKTNRRFSLYDSLCFLLNLKKS